MQEFSRRGFQSVIITSDSNALTRVPDLKSPFLIQQDGDLKICWVRTMKYSAAKSLRRILSWVDFEWRLFRMPQKLLPRPDTIIVSSLSLLTILNGLRLRRKFGCRLILEIRDIWPLTLTEEGDFSRFNPFVWFLGLVEKLGYRYADEVVGTMPNLGVHVADVLGYQRPVHCIPMGVGEIPQDDFSLVPDDYKQNYLPSGKFVVAHAGTIGISNALEVFLKCAASLDDRQDIHFLIIGDGGLRDFYREKYAHCGNVTFAPKVPKQAVHSILRRCDLLYFSVHISRVWDFGQSLNKVVDYMLSGKPILASYTGFPSMINEADCGSYVPAGDVLALRDEVLRYAAMSSKERDVIGKRGRAWLLARRHYSVLATDYLEVMFSGQYSTWADGAGRQDHP
jgi:glycosyltransferase involved in cell wall biosynthesis